MYEILIVWDCTPGHVQLFLVRVGEEVKQRLKACHNKRVNVDAWNEEEWISEYIGTLTAVYDSRHPTSVEADLVNEHILIVHTGAYV